MEHTPGPWEIRKTTESEDKGWAVFQKGKDYPCSITGWGSVTQKEADARLIASAPALLEKAEKLVDEAERVAMAAIDDGKRLPHLEHASANMAEEIAKAKGEL